TLGHELREVADLALSVSVTRATRLHRAQRAHPAIGLDRSIGRVAHVPWRLVDAGEQPAEHHRRRPRTDRFGDVAGLLDPSVCAHRNAVAVGGLGTVVDRRDLRHPRAGHDARRADGAGTDADLHAIGARRDELLGAFRGDHVARDHLHAMAGLDLLDHPRHAGRMAVRDVDDDDVDARPDQSGRALVGVARDTDGSADQDIGVFGAADLVDLLGDGEVTMDHSEATETAERNSHGRIGDGVHGRGEDRDVEADLVREAGLGRDLGREDVAAGGDQEDVVEGQAFFGELLLPGQPAALTRASVLEGVARYSSVAVRSGPIPTMPTRAPTLSSMRARYARAFS